MFIATLHFNFLQIFSHRIIEVYFLLLLLFFIISVILAGL